VPTLGTEVSASTYVRCTCGIVLSAFAEETPDGWRIAPPDTFTDEELIGAAATVYQEIADSNPQSMGKSKACYSQLLQITSLYKRLSK